MKTLYLFDIDGTLFNINKIHIDAYRMDYQSVGLKPSNELILSAFGMSESDGLKKVLNGLGANYDPPLAARIMRSHRPNFIRALGRNSIEPLEGVVDFLDELKADGQHIGVISGNLEQIAGIILEKSGLLPFFSLSSFDFGGLSRVQIVQRAVARARTSNYDFKRVVVIGDTPYDIEAGKAANTFTVGVATGNHSLQELAKTADLALPSLKEYKKIIEKIK